MAARISADAIALAAASSEMASLPEALVVVEEDEEEEGGTTVEGCAGFEEASEDGAEVAEE